MARAKWPACQSLALAGRHFLPGHVWHITHSCNGLVLRMPAGLTTGTVKAAICILIENDAYIMRLSCYIHRNPLRAEIVSRLIDYKWSSYPIIYSYGKKAPDWLSTQMILTYFKGAKKHKQYRQKVQKYADEEKSLL